MLITPHVAVGAAIGVATGDPIAGFAGGVASHFVLDAIPHTDPGTWHFYEDFSTHDLHAGDFTLGIVDVAVAVFGYVWLAGVAPLATLPSILGAMGGALPDALVLVGLFYPKATKSRFLKGYYELVEKYHRTARPNQWILGIVTQIVAVAVSVWYLVNA